ncbi:DNA breaking-rejoining enzyme [Ganoderma leucocontextum]|nr:DNA breaking-rejoining enzyme [Ganoderma leucocontextum]
MPSVRTQKVALARVGAHRQGKTATVATGATNVRPSSRTLSMRKPRKPRPENVIAPSPFRPHVAADERLALWSAPFAEKAREGARSLIPEVSLRHLFLTILQAIESDTRKNYGAGLLRFHQFCDQIHVPEDQRMPASEVLLASFVASWAGKVARTTVDNWLAGLAFWHTLNSATWHGDRVLKVTCAAATKLQPPPKPKRPPVTLEHMHALRAGLDLTDAFDAAVYAVACAAFWGCRRLGELVVPSRGSFDPKKHVGRRAQVQFRDLRGGAQYATFHIPWTKTTKSAGADVILTANGDPTTPDAAIRHHLRANQAVPGAAPLFSFETADGSWAPMTRGWFLDRCNEVWKHGGFAQLSGHCFRIGGATELLLRGTHPDIVATLGSWKSRAFLEYWRKIESILPLFISKSFDRSRLRLVSDSMKDFKKKYKL